MTEKLDDFRKQLEDLDAKLSDPDVMKDMSQYKNLMLERSHHYEFLTMLPYILVIVVLAFNRKSNRLGPTALGRPFNREMRV